MKVILISVIPNLGKIGDVIEVKNGYAKNFLIPNKKAICFTINNYKVFESKKHDLQKIPELHKKKILTYKKSHFLTFF
jgi:large subunit ribosomal protein L9